MCLAGSAEYNNTQLILKFLVITKNFLFSDIFVCMDFIGLDCSYFCHLLCPIRLGIADENAVLTPYQFSYDYKCIVL